MKKTYDIAGFTLVLDKITMISAVFEAKDDEGWQFNIRLVSGDFLPVKRPDRARATLDRELLAKAISRETISRETVTVYGLRFTVYGLRLSGEASPAGQAPTTGAHNNFCHHRPPTTNQQPTPPIQIFRKP